MLSSKVQRTIKRAKLMAFFCIFMGIIDATPAHVDNEGIIDGLLRGAMKCNGSKAKDVDLWIFIREEVRRVHQAGTLLDVEHVKAHRSKKRKPHMSLFGKWSLKPVMLDGGEMTQIRAGTVQRKERRFTRRCSAQLAFTD